MSQAAWPDSTALAAYMTDAGMTTTSAKVANYCSAAVREWERLTGWTPFLAETNPASWRFDPPEDGQTLDLKTAFIDVDTVAINVSSNYAGDVLVADEDYFLVPYENADGSGWKEIYFVSRVYGQARSITVVGKRGYCAAIPDDAYEAVLARAAALASPKILAAPGPASKVKQGSVEFTYSVEAGRDQIGQWNLQFAKTAARYRRITV